MASEPTTRALYASSDRSAFVRLEGPLRYTAARALRAFLDAALAQGPTELVLLDLRQTTYLDSTGLGLVARVGRLALTRSGRRAVIVCPENDVMTLLRSAALDVLFVMVDEPPVDIPSTLDEVPLTQARSDADGLGRVILEAHRDLAALSARNREEYRGVIAALESELEASRPARSG